VVNHIPYPEKVTPPKEKTQTWEVYCEILQNWIWLMAFGLPHVFKLQSSSIKCRRFAQLVGYDAHESSYLNLFGKVSPTCL